MGKRIQGQPPLVARCRVSQPIGGPAVSILVKGKGNDDGGQPKDELLKIKVKHAQFPLGPSARAPGAV